MAAKTRPSRRRSHSRWVRDGVGMHCDLPERHVGPHRCGRWRWSNEEELDAAVTKGDPVVPARWDVRCEDTHEGHRCSLAQGHIGNHVQAVAQRVWV